MMVFLNKFEGGLAAHFPAPEVGYDPSGGRMDLQPGDTLLGYTYEELLRLGDGEHELVDKRSVSTPTPDVHAA